MEPAHTAHPAHPATATLSAQRVLNILLAELVAYLPAHLPAKRRGGRVAHAADMAVLSTRRSQLLGSRVQVNVRHAGHTRARVLVHHDVESRLDPVAVHERLVQALSAARLLAVHSNLHKGLSAYAVSTSGWVG
eukprot:363205-Chlamydomonas_euryale.AAC.4